MPTTMKCHVCGKEIPNWVRREHKIYCISCFKAALEDRAGLSTHATEEANLRKILSELAGQER